MITVKPDDLPLRPFADPTTCTHPSIEILERGKFITKTCQECRSIWQINTELACRVLGYEAS